MNFDWPDIIFLQTVQGDSGLFVVVLTAILGAVAGALATFFVELYFRLREERRANRSRDHALYMFINQMMYDVTSIHTRLLETLGNQQWPVELDTKMQRMIGSAPANTPLDPNLLGVLRGPKAAGLVHQLFELRNLRDLTIQLQAALNVQVQELQELHIKHASSRENLRVTSSISSDHPDFPLIDIRRQEVSYTAKMLIQMGYTFVERMIDFGEGYNEFKSHPNKNVHSNLMIDLDELKSLSKPTSSQSG
ncbi:hypothetical protein [Hyphomonas jannaschiana]|uniref:Uncharacterized protein n=1 Tax=Hyphomonas jannaschiana VP2 TaxID=1280952 RepID=A0A059FEW8_9PROT|nr:hypothetical protein [Hyphomonas jannaschiana]KCZ89152.1 hypothetical protein HJA_07642 [Hyphomonas jannaschiana VP2]